MLTEPLKHFRGMITSEVGLLVDERVRSIIGLDAEALETIRLGRLMHELDITEQQDVEQ
jgi:hypothetical protein